jgi:hypothetical protein
MKRQTATRRLHMGCGEGLSGQARLLQRAVLRAAETETSKPAPMQAGRGRR